MKRSVYFFIDDILMNINNIESFIKNINKEDFLKNEEKQYAVVRALEIIGEAVKNIPNSFREKYSEIPWRDIAGFRDKLTHAYFGIILERVWKIIKKDMPELKIKILNIRKELGKIPD